MLIDKVDEKLLENNLAKDPGVIFYIDESVFDFSKPESFSGKSVDDNPLPQWLPFENFTIHFSDCLLTYYYFEAFEEGAMPGIIVDQLCIDKFGRRWGIWPKIFNKIAWPVHPDTYVCWLSKMVTLSQHNDILNYICDDIENTKDRELVHYFIPFYVLFNFLSFLSCKNVATEKIIPPQKQQAARRKRGKRPLVSYHVLKIQNTKVAYSETESKKLWSNRVHFCRGHVREYSEDRPLFGKHTGRFWVAPHVRGNKENGFLQKDYLLQR